MDEGPAYGYEMTRRLRARGLSIVGEGSIYPLLGSLERDGLVETYRSANNGGPPREDYRSSHAGRGGPPPGVSGGGEVYWVRGRPTPPARGATPYSGTPTDTPPP